MRSFNFSFIKYLLICGGFVALCYGLSGCSINKQFVATCQDSWKTIGEEYVKYVQADEKLDKMTKELRIRTADGFTAMLKAAE